MKEKIFELIDEADVLDYNAEYYYNVFFRYVDKCITMLKDYFHILPDIVQFLIKIFILLAFLEALISLGVAIYTKRKDYLLDTKNNLFYSYFFGTRNHLKKSVKKEFFKRLKAVNWNKFSISFWYNKLKSFEIKSIFLKLLVNLVCLPIAIVSFVERTLKAVIGFFSYKIVSAFEFVIYAFIKIIVLLIIPFVKTIYKMQLKKQKCVSCYREIEKVSVVCPSCSVHHNDLKPGKNGVFFAKCRCGQYINILPKMQGYNHFCCPYDDCSSELISCRNKQTTIAVFGGEQSGKTAWISSVYNMLSKSKNSTFANIRKGNNPKDVQVIETFFNSGKYTNDSNINQYTLYKANNIEKSIESLNIYELNSKDLSIYSLAKSPVFLSYTDGIVFILDPLNEKRINSHYNTYDLFLNFSQEYFSLTGKKSNKISEIPLAVIINKSDIPSVNSEIGPEKIQTVFNDSSAKFGKDLLCVENNICRQYLIDIGLKDLVDYLEIVFKTVCYFSVSAIGHENNGQPFSPVGVTSPIGWIISKIQSDFKISSKMY